MNCAYPQEKSSAPSGLQCNKNHFDRLFFDLYKAIIDKWMEVLSFVRLNIIPIIGITYNTMKPYFHMDYVTKIESVTRTPQNITYRILQCPLRGHYLHTLNSVFGGIQKPRSQLAGGRGSTKRSRKATRGEGDLPKGHVAKIIENFIKFSALKWNSGTLQKDLYNLNFILITLIITQKIRL